MQADSVQVPGREAHNRLWPHRRCKDGAEDHPDAGRKLLKDDIVKFEQMVMKYNHIYHWNQNQLDALVSFAFNIGNIDQLTNKGKRNIPEISRKMLEYNKIEKNGRKEKSPGLYSRRKQERALFDRPVQQTIQAASTEPDPEVPTHIQLNYQPGKTYQAVVDGLRIRTKRASQDPIVLPNGNILGIVNSGKKVRNQATARVGDQIWMYIGLDAKGREQWLCADNGQKAYVK